MSRRGTTMAEMLVTMTLICILASVAASKMKISSRTMVEQNAMLLAQNLDMARTKAYSSRARVRVLVTDSTWRSFLDDNRDSLFVENTTEQTAYGPMNNGMLSSKVVFSRGAASRLASDTVSVTPTTFRVQFSPGGVAEPFGSTKVIYLSYSTRNTSVYAVEVSPGANVRVWRWLNNSWQ